MVKLINLMISKEVVTENLYWRYINGTIDCEVTNDKQEGNVKEIIMLLSLVRTFRCVSCLTYYFAMSAIYHVYVHYWCQEYSCQHCSCLRQRKQMYLQKQDMVDRTNNDKTASSNKRTTQSFRGQRLFSKEGESSCLDTLSSGPE